MKLGEYEKFVRESDWTIDKPGVERFRIARYGLAAEVGSLCATLKRKVLGASSDKWNVKNHEIIEELGDCLWYTVQLSTIDNGNGFAAVVEADLSALPKEIRAKPEFLAALPLGALDEFTEKSIKLLSCGPLAEIDDYQHAAILTARTQGRDLIDVCLTRLLLYATSIMSHQFPKVEYHLKDDIQKFSNERTLGMLLWHLSAIATVYDLSLSEVARYNRMKLESVSNLSGQPPSPLFDRVAGVPSGQQFPDKFDIAYISTGSGKAQMFFRGRQLGDELDDNSDTDDGYRFHDALHLSNAAILGWSPVLRSLMGLKRKYDPSIDRKEDGARARIVEEAIVKAVHSEALRVAESEGLDEIEARKRLFSNHSQISFHFLKLVKTFARGLEVDSCQAWEWQRAIIAGHRLYVQLHEEKQGTVTVDLQNREVTFSSLVVADFRGPVVDSTIELVEFADAVDQTSKQAARTDTEKNAILRILGLDAEPDNKDLIDIQYSHCGEISVKAHGVAQQTLWDRSILGFRTKWTDIDQRGICMAMAIGAPA